MGLLRPRVLTSPCAHPVPVPLPGPAHRHEGPAGLRGARQAAHPDERYHHRHRGQVLHGGGGHVPACRGTGDPKNWRGDGTPGSPLGGDMVAGATGPPPCPRAAWLFPVPPGPADSPRCTCCFAPALPRVHAAGPLPADSAGAVPPPSPRGHRALRATVASACTAGCALRLLRSFWMPSFLPKSGVPGPRVSGWGGLFVPKGQILSPLRVPAPLQPYCAARGRRGDTPKVWWHAALRHPGWPRSSGEARGKELLSLCPPPRGPAPCL